MNLDNIQLTPAYENFIVRYNDSMQIQLDNDSNDRSITYALSDVDGNLCNLDCYVTAEPYYEDIDKIIFYRYRNNNAYIMAFYRSPIKKAFKRNIALRNYHPLSKDEIFNILDYYYLSDTRIQSLLE